VDRLGRTILHLVIQYDIHEVLSLFEFETGDLLVKDMNGDTPIDYCCIYNAYNSFKSIFEIKNFAEFYKVLITFNSRYLENCLI
jgi:hypothetical protein